MHFRHLTYQTSELSPAALKHARTTHINLHEGCLEKKKASTVSCDLLSTTLKVKTSVVICTSLSYHHKFKKALVELW